MNPVSFTPQSYQVDGKHIYLMSGEFHYFRVPKADWRERMRLFKAAGGNCLATYIPWLIHEPQEGTFRFGGEDWLDLEAFLRVALEEDLYVIARPGPYQYSELVYDGLPGWLVQQYPQILAQDAQGRAFRESSVSYLHPLFLEKVRNWFNVVCPLLAPHMVDRGGPVAFVQLDNEMVGIHEWFGTLDYHPVTMGFAQPGGRYPTFLRRRYGQIDALNTAYGHDYTNFEQVFPTHPTTHPLAALRRRKDYYEFYLGTIAEYSLALAAMIRAHGISVPLVHNSGNPGMNAHFLETIQALGSSYLLGSDHYYNLGQDWPQNNPTPQYALRMFVSLEQLRLMGFPPTVFELPGGSASDWPPITAADALACYLANLAFGMRGSNYYIFTGGPNPPGAGKSTDLYDYGAGIGAHGEIRPLYQAQKTFGEAVTQRPWLSSAARTCDLRVALDFEQARSSYYWTEPVEGLFSASQAWDLLRCGPLTAALCAGLSPELVDLSTGDWTAETACPLLVVCASSMSAAKQQRLADFVRLGGKALFMPVLPSLDENMNPCTILLHALGLEQFTYQPVEQARPTVAGVENINGQAVFCEPPPGAQVIGLDEFTGRPLAWTQPFVQGGLAAFVGLSWSYAMHEQGRMLKNVLQLLGLQPILHCSNPNVWVTLWEKDGQALLFLLNLFTEPMPVEVTIHRRDLPGITIKRTVAPITVDLIDLTL